ncbi:DNA repair protein rad52 [Coelomomyces lativittatus]|nr:DNA repair protein rad52 [Coelomomyces lativittatus]
MEDLRSTSVFFDSIVYDVNDTIQVTKALQTKLPSEYISQRAGSGPGGNVMYLEGWKAIEIANEIFGYNGWSSQIVNQVIDFQDFVNEKWSVGIHCTVRVTLKNGSYHEDNGYGLSENTRSKGLAIEKARKEASTDALKRTLRLFGNALGNCLGDKEYLRKMCQPNKKFNPTLPAPPSTSHPSRPNSVIHNPVVSTSDSNKFLPNPSRTMKVESQMYKNSTLEASHGEKLGVIHSAPPPSFSSSSSNKPLSRQQTPTKQGPHRYPSVNLPQYSESMDWT